MREAEATSGAFFERRDGPVPAAKMPVDHNLVNVGRGIAVNASAAGQMHEN
jgi:hypothetical protein